MADRVLNVSTTIFALSSGKLPAAVAIVRLSGPEAFSIAGKIAPGVPLHIRGMYLAKLKSSEGETFDEALVLSFPNPASFTGQDVVEFQCHGSIPVVEKLEQTLHAFGAIPAERGEFSYRAFLGGKMDAQDIEQLGDLFLAKDSADLKAIYLRHDAATKARVDALREKAIQLQAILDTAIDFADEYAGVVASARVPLEALIRECSWMLSRYSGLRLERDVPRLVLAGRPNAGKSSLFNAILCRYRAIVHAEAGTTRDVIEEDFSLGDVRWKLVDTAGVRGEAGETEAQGIEIAEQYLKNAALWLLVVDSAAGLAPEDWGLLEKFSSIPHLVVWNKVDATKSPAPGNLQPKAVGVSALKGDGLSELMERVAALAPKASEGESAFLPTASQAKRLRAVVEKLETVSGLLSNSAPPEYLAEESRQVLSLLEDLVGYVDPEVVLDRIFSDFCIGK